MRPNVAANCRLLSVITGSEHDFQAVVGGFERGWERFVELELGLIAVKGSGNVGKIDRLAFLRDIAALAEEHVGCTEDKGCAGMTE